MMAREFKDSGIEWIGKIPKEWKTNKFKHLFRIKKILAGKLGYDVLSVTQQGLKVKNIISNEGQVANDYTNYQLVFPNDFVMNHMDLLTGYVDVSKQIGVTSPDYRTFYAINKQNIINKYYLYIFQFCYKTRLFYNLGQGVSNFGRWRLPAEQQNEFILPFPPICMQQRIADYLDKKCGEIDELIALQEQMIAQLTDYKQSVITEAVTKGLDPDAEFIPSGIDWIGDVPKGWKVNKVNRMFRVIGSGTTPNSSDDDAYIGTINWLQSGDINGGILTKANKRISKETLVKYSALSIYKAPFIIVAMYGASVGNISISHIDACVNQACCVLGESAIDFTYAFYAIKSSQRYLIFRAVGGGQPNISQYTLRQLWVPEPPISEQHAIATYLDTKCSEIDSLIAIKQQKIETLKDYKKSVIYEAVTGKMTIGESPCFL